MFEEIKEKSEDVISWMMSLLKKSHPLTLALSMGKDSSACVVLLLEAIKRCVDESIPIPQCYVTHSDTTIENPAMSFYAHTMLDQLEAYIEKHDLPITVLRVKPSLASTFAYATIGRGKLPRFVNSKNRDCSVDWKVRPQQKAIQEVVKKSNMVSMAPVVSFHGSRKSESQSRSNKMSRRGDDNKSLVQQENGTFSNAPISNWEVEDVWMLLMSCGSDRNNGNRMYETFVDDFNWCLQLYKDANDGACAIITGDGGSKSACGSRWGCAWCTVSSRNGDKSMESLIASDSEYSYLVGINKFSNLLVNTQYDLKKRDWLGRTISDAGYVRIRPDNYSSMFRRQLLRYLLTLDILEEERGERHEASLLSGEIDDTAANRRLCSPQFQFITPQLVLSIDMMWSLQRDFDHAFPAVREWYEIRELGKRYLVPDTELLPPVKIPEARWYKAETFDHPWMITGLRDPLGEAVNLKRKPGEAPYAVCNDLNNKSGVRRVIAHETDTELTIDPEDAAIFVCCEFESMYFDTLNFSAKDGLMYLIDRGLIKIGSGMIGKYDYMARRADFYNRMKQRFNVANLTPILIDKSIGNAEHNELLKALNDHQETIDDVQADLFFAA